MKIVRILATFTALASIALADPLPSWNDTAPKKAIIAFVENVTTTGSLDYVVPAAHIATFDNGGCLWSEQPMYLQSFFLFDRIKAFAPQHPEWTDKEPFALVLQCDIKGAPAAYDHESHIGLPGRSLDEGPERRWAIVGMKDDLAKIYLAVKP